MTENRRTNGLTATAWVPLGEIDPRVAQAVLAALAREGIAAYVSPATGTPGPYLDVRLPGRPVDRLHVDAARRVEAERVLSLHEPPAAESGGPVDTDAIFAAIVAGWDAPEQTDPVARWSVSEETDPRGEPTAPREHAIFDPRPSSSDDRGDDDDDDPVDRLLGDGKWAQMGSDVGPDVVEEHYEPPPPPPVPRPQKATFAAMVSILGGVLLLVWQALTSDPSGGKQVLAVVMILVGAGVLVARMRDRAGDGDDDWDDGAVV
ncbi:MAG TPA: hypothetical protein VHE83_11270 [Mycobacteriales bacterium]|nr:hypothetical protein [Mycobacteriales bacterium]